MRSTIGVSLALALVACGGGSGGDAAGGGRGGGGATASSASAGGVGGIDVGETSGSGGGKRGLYDDYRKTSPHYAHVTPMYTDFYYGWTPAERDWAAAHFDMAMSGTMSEWKSRNPTVKHITYRLHWTVFQPGPSGNDDYTDLTTWFGDAGLNTHHDPLEHAFLHYPAGVQFRDYAHASADQIAAYNLAGDVTKLPLVTATGGGSEAERIQTHIWDSWRYVYNPADAGSSAYLRYKVGTIVKAGHDGVFYDEYGSGGMTVAYTSLEMDTAAYQSAATAQMSAERAAFPGKVFMPNTASYMFAFDLQIMEAAGHTQLEQTNNPLDGNMVDRWDAIDGMVSSGVEPELVGSQSWTGQLPSTFVAGNYETPVLRLKIAELASYYMVRPKDASRMLLDQNSSWTDPPSQHWLRAEEADVGAPITARAVLSKTTDPVGQASTIYTREYERALVLMRPVVGWDPPDYGDDSAVTAMLPTGEKWYLLGGDGTTHGPITRVDLRVAEAAILVKASAVSGL